MHKELIFAPISRDTATEFLPFRDDCCFGDMTFPTLFAWQPMFDYAWAHIGECLVIRGTSRAGDQSYILLGNLEDRLSCLSALLPSVQSTGMLQLEYVRKEELTAFEEAARAADLQFSASSEDRYSDYLYLRLDYCSLQGGRQKSLRGDIHALQRQFPDLRYERFGLQHMSACLAVFDSWCSGRQCQNCAYGCEREAMARFLQVWREPECFGAMAFSGETLLGFLVGEKLPGGILDIHFQKNRIRQRGLTYWLSRELALQTPECLWIDLEEDMGIPGIRMDKQRLHPTERREKYTVVLRPKELERSS